jgi:hypothetical protein
MAVWIANDAQITWVQKRGAEFQETLSLGPNRYRVYPFAGNESKTEMADGP